MATCAQFAEFVDIIVGRVPNIFTKENRKGAPEPFSKDMYV